MRPKLTHKPPGPLEAAIALREAGHYREAAASLEGWIGQQPQDAAAHALLAQVLLLDRRSDAAGAAIARALALDGGLPVVQRNLARVLLQRRQLDAALQAAQAAVRLEPDEPENLLVLAAALGAGQRDAQALPHLERALQIRPDYAEAYANRAQLRLRAGAPAAALADLEQALALKPHLPHFWGLAARLRLQFKDLPGAIAALRKALEFEPGNTAHMITLGEFLRQDGQLDSALAILENATAAAPDNHGAWVNFGTALQEAGHIDAAKAAYGKALAINPASAEVASNLGALAMAENDWEEALRRFDQALAATPEHDAILGNRASALSALGRHEEAERSARLALAAKPEDRKRMRQLASILDGLKRHEEALCLLREALAQAPEDADTLQAIAGHHAARFNWEDAARYCRQAAAIRPDCAAFRSNLGAALWKLGEIQDAEACMRQAIQIDPGHAPGHVGLGQIFIDQGEFALAEAHIGQALNSDPGAATAWAQLSDLRKMTPADTAWLERAKQQLDSPKTGNKGRIALLYAMGKYHDDTRDYAQAFAHYRKANELKKTTAPAYDRKGHAALVDELAAAHGREFIGRAWPGASDSPRPLFIVGMPRSGTSLLEQILASHARIFGAGELLFWSKAMEGFAEAFGTGQYGAELIGGTAAACLDNLARHSREALRVVDKMPQNFLLLGFIHACFPNARILHATRNPADTCLSIYFQDFDRLHAYANDLDDLAHYYREYHRLMAHWRAVLPPGVFMDVPYEAVVEDTEGWSRRIIEFIGLDWDENCLNFHETRRRVGTTSNWQVRQPVYKSSRGRWRNYESFVGPLLPLLELDAPRGEGG